MHLYRSPGVALACPIYRINRGPNSVQLALKQAPLRVRATFWYRHLERSELALQGPENRAFGIEHGGTRGFEPSARDYCILPQQKSAFDHLATSPLVVIPKREGFLSE